MLVLRKELKLGVGIGATVLGIAGVYGLMAMLSSGNADRAGQPLAINSTEGRSGLDHATGGLPPVDEPVVKPAEPVKTSGGDPFSEAIRTDGNTKTNPWTADAFTTGRVGGDVKAPPAVVKLDIPKADVPKSMPGGPDVTRAPAFASAHAFGAGAGTKATPEPTVAAGVTDNTAVAKSAPTGKYVIQSGDTFSTIAAKFYGSKRYSAVLVKANPEINPSRLRIGHEINVPAKESLGGGTARGSIEAGFQRLTSPIDATRQYRVGPGDTLSRIATKLYGKSTMWLAIYDANKSAIGSDAGRLKLGQVLELPQKPVS